MYDLVVTGGTVVTPTGVQELDVAVRGEQVAAIGAPGSFPEAARMIDAHGQIVIPGGIDPHAHYDINFMGTLSEGPDYAFAAAAGGTTTLVDFVFHESQADPYVTPMEAIEWKRERN